MTVRSPAPSETLSPFTDEEELYRTTVRTFLHREIDSTYKVLEQQGGPTRDLWRRAGDAGILGITIPEKYGGPDADPIMYAVLGYEIGRSVGSATTGSTIAGDLLSDMLVQGGNEEQKQRWLPSFLTGECIQAFALTEPNAGSDATAIRSTARRDDDTYIVNGSKTFITNANKADLFYVVVKTDIALRGKGMSVLLVEGDRLGIDRRPLKTMGFKAMDIAEVTFTDVRVPAENRLGTEGSAMSLLFSSFAIDRLQISARALGMAELAFSLTLDYVKQRQAFGKRILDFQNTQFKLAEVSASLDAARAFLHEGVRKVRANRFSFADGAKMKLWMCEMAGTVADECLQLHGGNGFMDEMPISRIYTAVRALRIYAGTSELQKVSIAKTFDE